MKRIKLFFSWLYTLDHYEGVEAITWRERYYKRRIGIKRAWYISGYILKHINQ